MVNTQVKFLSLSEGYLSSKLVQECYITIMHAINYVATASVTTWLAWP